MEISAVGALLHKSKNRIVPRFEWQIFGEQPRHTQASRLGCSPKICPRMAVQDRLSDLCNNAAVGEGLEIEADLVVGKIENQAFSGKIPQL